MAASAKYRRCHLSFFATATLFEIYILAEIAVSARAQHHMG